MSKVSINTETAAHNIAQVVTEHYLSYLVKQGRLDFNSKQDVQSLSADVELMTETYEAAYKAAFDVLTTHEAWESK